MTTLNTTHKLAWCGDLMIAACRTEEDLNAIVRDECPADIADAWESDGMEVDVLLTADPLEDEDGDLPDGVSRHYDGNAVGYLPDGYHYAYTIS